MAGDGWFFPIPLQVSIARGPSGSCSRDGVLVMRAVEESEGLLHTMMECTASPRHVQGEGGGQARGKEQEGPSEPRISCGCSSIPSHPVQHLPVQDNGSQKKDLGQVKK